MQRRSRGRCLALIILAGLLHWSSHIVASFVGVFRLALPLASLQPPPHADATGRETSVPLDAAVATERQTSVLLDAEAADPGRWVRRKLPLVRIDMPDDFADKFKNVHWIWQHAYQRFQCWKLALPDQAGAISDADLPRAWELFYDLGAAHHAEVEDELFLPFVRQLDGGDVAVQQLLRGHEELNAKALQVQEALKDGGAAVRAVIAEYAEMYVEHINLEEDLLVPIVLAGMREDLWKDVAPLIKAKSSASPGGKMALCLFRELSTQEVIAPQYRAKLPGIMRRVLIPVFSMIDSQYSAHRRIFGAIPEAV